MFLLCPHREDWEREGEGRKRGREGEGGSQEGEISSSFYKATALLDRAPHLCPHLTLIIS